MDVAIMKEQQFTEFIENAENTEFIAKDKTIRNRLVIELKDKHLSQKLELEIRLTI